MYFMLSDAEHGRDVDWVPRGPAPPNTLQALMTAAAAGWDSYQRTTESLQNTRNSHMKRVQTGLGEMIAYLQPLLRMNQQLPWLTSPSRIPLYVLSWIIHCSRVKSYFGEDLGFFGAKPLDIWGCPPVLQGFKWFLNHSRLMYDYCDVFCPSCPCQKHSGWTVEVRTGAVTWCFHS